MAALLATRRGGVVKIEAVSDPAEPARLVRPGRRLVRLVGPHPDTLVTNSNQIIT